MKKVAIVYHYVAHYRKGIFQRLSKNQDYQFEIISGNESNIKIEILDASLAERELSEGGIRWSFVKNMWVGELLWQRGLLKKIRKENYDAVIFLGCVYYISTWVAAIYCRMVGIKVLMWGHGYIKSENNIKGFVRRLFYSLAQTHFIYSGFSIEQMRAHGLGSKRLFQVNNSLDYDEQLVVREKLKHVVSYPYPEEWRDGVVLVFVGRLTKQKKLGLLIRTVKLLVDKGIDVYCFLIGGGEQQEELRAYSMAFGLADRVVFHGACYDEIEVAKFIYHADLCVSPGEVGLTAMHALVYGTPVITHNNFKNQMPEFEAVVPGSTGDFFVEDSSDSLADVIGDWVSKYGDRNEVRRKCFSVIDQSYTPAFQEEVFVKGLNETLSNA